MERSDIHLDDTFWDSLEYSMTGKFRDAITGNALKGLWCDGVITKGFRNTKFGVIVYGNLWVTLDTANQVCVSFESHVDQRYMGKRRVQLEVKEILIDLDDEFAEIFLNGKD